MDTTAITQVAVVSDNPNAYHRIYEEDDDEMNRIIRDYFLTNKKDIASDEPSWFRLGCACYAVLGDDEGRLAFHVLSQYHPRYNYTETNEKFDNIQRHMYNRCGLGTLIYLCRQAGIMPA